jgi:hypothetical protein
MLERDIGRTDFSDQVMLFCCHGTGSGIEGSSTSAPSLKLSHNDTSAHKDGSNDLLSGSDFEVWLGSRHLPEPVVLIDACHGAQMETLFYRSFAWTLLNRRVNCLIGPQVTLPVTFAQAYTERFLERFLVPETRIGDTVRDLARAFADEHRNPLGLIFSLYRGLNTHLRAKAS